MRLSAGIAALKAALRRPKGPASFVHRHDPASVRARLRAATRAAFLSDLSPHERRLAQISGDTQ